jgi:TonB family protein
LTFVSALLGTALQAAPAVAAEPAAARWNVDWGDRQCTLVRQVEQGPILALRTTPGSTIWELRVANPSWPDEVLANLEATTVTLDPGGAVAAPYVSSERTMAGRVLVFNGLPMEFPGTFAAARTVRVSPAGSPPIEFSLTSTDRALAALRACENDLLQRWGVDPAAFRRLRSPPRGDLSQFVDNDDYPAEALRQGLSGEVIMRLTVSIDGRVADCAVVASSGHSTLDNATCRIMQRRVRLTPATGADGNPIVAPLVTSVNWSVSG